LKLKRGLKFVELNKKSLKKRLEKIDFLSKKHIIAKNKEVENQPL